MSRLLQDDEYEHEETVFYKAAFHCFDWNHSGRIATSVSWSFIPQPFCLSYITFVNDPRGSRLWFWRGYLSLFC